MFWQAVIFNNFLQDIQIIFETKSKDAHIYRLCAKKVVKLKSRRLQTQFFWGGG